jgi:hypothetical protein
VRDPQRVTHRRKPTPRQHERELDQHGGIDPRPPGAAGPVERLGRPPHVAPVDQRLDPAQIVIGGHEIVH